tara:strand:+ start:724 stop:1794 length:1071 start_codon:yes stop_codon:yes gene_type:complete
MVWQTEDVNRGLVLGLAVALITSGCSGGSDSAELQALREKVEALEAQTTTTAAPASSAATVSDELLVLSAIAEFMPDGQVCEEELMSADSPERGREGWGHGWETEIDGFEELVVQITCDFESAEFWFSHQLRIQYPLKTGEGVELINSVINSAVRSEVAKGILDYFNDSRERFADLRLTEEEQRSDQTQNRGCSYSGYLYISGVVTYSNGGLYSVYLLFGQNHPCANTTGSPVVTLNFDVFGKPDTRGYDRPRMHFGLSDLFKGTSDWMGKLTEIILRGEDEAVTYPEMSAYLTPEFLWSMDFTMGPETLTLHAQPYSIWFPGWCCGASPKHLEINYEELTDYLDPDGPYRLILNN